MSKFLNLNCLVVAAILLAAAVTMSSCKDDDDNKREFTVTFNSDGGTPTPPTQTVTEGGRVAEPANISRAGTELLGWYLPLASVPWVFGEYVVKSDMILTARWFCIVTFNQNYNDAPEPTTANVVLGRNVTEPEEPTRDEYVFAGWFQEEACTTPWDFATEPVTAHFTLYAKWLAAYIVTLNLNYDNAPEPTIVNVVQGDYVDEPEEPIRQGYPFAGWFTDEACTTPWDFETAITANLQLYAKWSAFIGEAEMILVQGGTRFMMNRQITLSSYSIGKYPVTQRQWLAVMGSNPSGFQTSDLHPVENMTFNQIVGTQGASVTMKGMQYFEDGFIYKLNRETGKNYRLLTEAEWEFAARGGNLSLEFTWSGSNNADEVAWHSGNSGGTTRPVGLLAPNELGIHDMCGNVYEYVSDWSATYPSTSDTDPTGPATGVNKVVRGGRYTNSAAGCVIIDRNEVPIALPLSNVGFRLALEVQ